ALDDLRLDVELERPGAPAYRGGPSGFEYQQVGLEGPEPAFSHFLSQLPDIVHSAHGGAPDHLLEALVMAGAVHPAMRPVHGQAVAQPAPQKLMYRHAQRLGLDVQACVLESGDGEPLQAAGGRLRDVVETCGEPAHPEGILAD